jgi:response regulator RpfG family c-di-GMP phosphodiesterase
MAAKQSVLCVDDEERVVQGLKLTLGRRFNVQTATSGAEAIDRILGKADGAFAVVMSDMRMPVMNGAQLLSEVRVLSPDSTRMLLTGHSDLESAISAINEGQIFRFLTKPCPPEHLISAIDAAVEQHRLVMSERVLLDQTLRGAINMLTDVLAMVSPTVFGRAVRLRECAKLLGTHLKTDHRWAIEIAAMLSQLPVITLPTETIDKLFQGDPLTTDERQMVERLGPISEQLLANIPRLELVRDILRSVDRPYDLGRTDLAGHPIGSRILKVALDFDALDGRGMDVELALETMRSRKGIYDPKVLEKFCELSGGARRTAEVRELKLVDLRPGMVLAEPVVTRAGNLLCARGNEVSPSLLVRLKNFASNAGIKEPIRVIVKKLKLEEEAKALEEDRTRAAS